LVEKSRSYALSDRNTPYLGSFVCAVLAAATESNYVKNDKVYEWIRGWQAKTSEEKEDQYPNEYGPWMDDVANGVVERERVDGWRMHLQGCFKLDDFLQMPALAVVPDPKPKVTCVYDDKYHEVSAPPAVPAPTLAECKDVRAQLIARVLESPVVAPSPTSSPPPSPSASAPRVGFKCQKCAASFDFDQKFLDRISKDKNFHQPKWCKACKALKQDERAKAQKPKPKPDLTPKIEEVAKIEQPVVPAVVEPPKEVMKRFPIVTSRHLRPKGTPPTTKTGSSAMASAARTYAAVATPI